MIPRRYKILLALLSANTGLKQVNEVINFSSEIDGSQKIIALQAYIQSGNEQRRENSVSKIGKYAQCAHVPCATMRDKAKNNSTGKNRLFQRHKLC